MRVLHQEFLCSLTTRSFGERAIIDMAQTSERCSLRLSLHCAPGLDWRFQRVLTTESGLNMATASAERQWKPRVNPWVIAATVALAAFMEVLDTSIANVALPHISGNLGASTDEGTWVLTSYLVSNAIVLPMGAWASSVIGRKRFFLLCITIFTVA